MTQHQAKPPRAARRVSCPTCGKPVEWSEAYPERPFCSDRCRLIDLGEWASEGYRIPVHGPETGEMGAGDAEPDDVQAADPWPPK